MTDHGPCVLIPLSLFESLELDASHQSSAALMRDTPGERQYWKGFLKAIETMRLLAGVDPTIDLDSSLQRLLPGIGLSTHKEPPAGIEPATVPPGEPVPGEFVLMQQLVFGISRDNVSASDMI